MHNNYDKNCALFHNIVKVDDVTYRNHIWKWLWNPSKKWVMLNDNDWLRLWENRNYENDLYGSS